jgi:hypothetical protein
MRRVEPQNCGHRFHRLCCDQSVPIRICSLRYKSELQRRLTKSCLVRRGSELLITGSRRFSAYRPTGRIASLDLVLRRRRSRRHLRTLHSVHQVSLPNLVHWR